MSAAEEITRGVSAADPYAGTPHHPGQTPPAGDVLAPDWTTVPVATHVADPAVIPRAFRRSAGVGALWTRAAELSPPVGGLIAVTSADGGVGRSVLTAGLGAVLASAAPGPVLAVDTTLRPWGGLEHRVDHVHDQTMTDAARLVPDWGLDSDLAGIAQPGPAGVHILLGDTPDSGRDLLAFDQVAPVVAFARTRYALTLLDLPTADAAWVVPCLASSTVTVLVARSTAESVHHTMRLLTGLRDRGLHQLPGRTVVVVMGTSPRSARDVVAAQRQMRTLVDDVVRVPYDPQLARSTPVEPGQLRRPTLNALVAVATAVLQRCPARREQPVWEPRSPAEEPW